MIKTVEQYRPVPKRLTETPTDYRVFVRYGFKTLQLRH